MGELMKTSMGKAIFSLQFSLVIPLSMSVKSQVSEPQGRNQENKLPLIVAEDHV